MKQKKISIIIPALNEEENIGSCLDRITDTLNTEIIISDGGSSDKTVEIAKQYSNVKIVASSKGRGIQMNTGASYASGDILIFLHADCILPGNAIQSVRRALENTAIAGGAFRIRLSSHKLRYRFLERGINLRSRIFRLPYGDQGLFVKRSVFTEMGGFKEIAVCEDLDFIWRLRKYHKMVILNERISSSVRRWEKNGFLWTSLRNQFLLASYVIRLIMCNFRCKQYYNK